MQCKEVARPDIALLLAYFSASESCIPPPRHVLKQLAVALNRNKGQHTKRVACVLSNPPPYAEPSAAEGDLQSASYKRPMSPEVGSIDENKRRHGEWRRLERLRPQKWDEAMTPPPSLFNVDNPPPFARITSNPAIKGFCKRPALRFREGEALTVTLTIPCDPSGTPSRQMPESREGYA